MQWYSIIYDKENNITRIPTPTEYRIKALNKNTALDLFKTTKEYKNTCTSILSIKEFNPIWNNIY